METAFTHDRLLPKSVTVTGPVFLAGPIQARLRARLLVIGVEDGFSGARYIRRRVSQDCPGLVIHSSLEETCRAAIAAARKP